MKTILITAGPTFEPIDPVRGLTNRSTGIMGYEIAKEAARRGLAVTLVSGPVSIKPPPGVKTVCVETALDMYKAVMKTFKKADCFVMAAAVSDYRPETVFPEKLKKRKNMTLKLTVNRDILKSVPHLKRQVRVGFALESENLAFNAVKKMRAKKLDFIVANSITPSTSPFGEGDKDFTIFARGGRTISVRNKSKVRLSKIILDMAEDILNRKKTAVFLT
ncbi:MAG: phosphopantothenoylcysteine decarboxylase [Candidatus Omnitrophota bacterium]